MKKQGRFALAYYDSFDGLVPVRVLRQAHGGVVVEVTATRRGYKRGDGLLIEQPERIIPRDKVFVRGGKYMIHRNPQPWLTRREEEEYIASGEHVSKGWLVEYDGCGDGMPKGWYLVGLNKHGWELDDIFGRREFGPFRTEKAARAYIPTVTAWERSIK